MTGGVSLEIIRGDENLELNERQILARKKVCLPLDNLKTLDEAMARVKELSPVVGLFKVGMESFGRFGPDFVRRVDDCGAEVFLDQKYHDIPNTVEGAANAAAGLGVYVFNVHASGGRDMLKAAVEGVRAGAQDCGAWGKVQPRVIGVTVLTSIGPAEYLDVNNVLMSRLSYDELAPFFGMKTGDREKQKAFAELLEGKGYGHLVVENEERGKYCNVVEQEVLHLAKMSADCGLDGIVCAGADLHAITEQLPEGFMYVTPGIKGPKTAAGSDQNRVMTPGRAVRDGSSILVIGRAITGGKTPEERLQNGYDVLEDMAKYL